jgi:hypothetical protein
MIDYVVKNSTLVFSQTELDALGALVKAGDRAGFYLAYYAMTDSGEAYLQAKIATFSGLAGGAALAANQMLQTQYGADPNLPYPGIYYLSQQVALSGYQAILSNVSDGGLGKINDTAFFASAKAAWVANGVGSLFPGNLLPDSGLTWNDLFTQGSVTALLATAYAPWVGKTQSMFPSDEIITLPDGSQAAVDGSRIGVRVRFRHRCSCLLD